jgi:hypothetical protein
MRLPMNSLELLATEHSNEVWFQKIERPYAFKSPFSGRRYVAVVFVNDTTVTDQERDSVVRALFNSGCRYGVFAGHKCGRWEAALDRICIGSSPDKHQSDEDFTGTTSHYAQSVKDIMFFGLICTQSEQKNFDRFLVLFVGGDSKLCKDVEEAIRWIHTREANEEKLVRNIKERLPKLQNLLHEVEGEKGIRDGVYYFYFDRWNRPLKVLGLAQPLTQEIVAALTELSPEGRLNKSFSDIVTAGIGHRFKLADNKHWPQSGRAVLEALFHAHFFLRMVCEYGKDIEDPADVTESGWDAVRCLYDLK